MDEAGANEQRSKYNEASLQIMRLHNLWTNIEVAFNKGELYRVQFLLDSVKRELYADIFHLGNSKAKSKIHFDKKLKEIIAKSKRDSDLYYESLSRRHEFLKRLQDEVGKGGVFSDGTEDDFD